MSKRLPVVKRGGKVVAYALVDPDVYDWAKDEGWTLSNGYARRSTAGRKTSEFLHRLILGLAPGSHLEADHINRNKLDNRRSNLRAVTRAENTQNREIRTPKSSRYRGVSFHPSGAWQASVMVNRVPHRLGSFLSEEIAGVVAEQARRQLHTHAEPNRRLAEDGLAGFAELAELVCGCGATSDPREARYWQLSKDGAVCEDCNGYERPRVGPKFKPLRICANCGRGTDHMKRGRCDSCYTYWRRTGRDNPAPKPRVSAFIERERPERLEPA